MSRQYLRDQQSPYMLHPVSQKFPPSSSAKDVPLVEFMFLVFTHMAGESYHSKLGALLLCLRDVFQVLINSLVFDSAPALVW